MDDWSGPAVAPRLLDRIRVQLGDPAVGYAEPPAVLRGGYDTRIYAFRLAGAPGEWAGPLILRALGPQTDPARALREGAMQNAVAALGYPAPRVLVASADPAALGAAFLVMARLPGRPLLEVRRVGVAAALARMQRALHALDAEPVLAAMDGVGGRDAVTFDGLLSQLRARVARRSLGGLREVAQWLDAHRPPPPARAVVCHGDLHPQNVLADQRGAVTGVIDWPNALVADPAYDLASTRIILGMVPVELSSVSPALRGLVRAARPLLLAHFRRPRAMSRAAFDYYEVASAMRHLVRAAEARRDAAAGGPPLGPLDASAFGDRLSARVAALTRCRVSL